MTAAQGGRTAPIDTWLRRSVVLQWLRSFAYREPATRALTAMA